jgi:putative phosphoesterase
MKIGVLSDTHLHSPSSDLIEVSTFWFKEVDFILHAGDLVTLDVLKAFGDKKVVAVRGNMDLPEVTRKFNLKEVVELGGFRIGLIHGWGAPRGLEEKIRKEFDKVDAIVYGHTHQAANHVREGVLFFNPGAFKTSYHGERSIGILTIGQTVSGEIIPV